MLIRRLVMVSSALLRGDSDQVTATAASNQALRYLAYIYSIPATYTMLLSKALVAGAVSSLPSLVLRSMLKQRRILLRMQ